MVNYSPDHLFVVVIKLASCFRPAFLSGYCCPMAELSPTGPLKETRGQEEEKGVWVLTFHFFGHQSLLWNFLVLTRKPHCSRSSSLRSAFPQLQLRRHQRSQHCLQGPLDFLWIFWSLSHEVRGSFQQMLLLWAFDVNVPVVQVSPPGYWGANPRFAHVFPAQDPPFHTL